MKANFLHLNRCIRYSHLMTISTSNKEAVARRNEMPMAFGKPAQHQPISTLIFTELLKPFINATTAQCYFGPSGIDQSGIPWLVVVTQNPVRPRRYRESGNIAMLAWRWDLAPGCPFSLTVMGLNEPRPHARWFATSEDRVVDAIRLLGRFHVCLAHPTGARSGWFEAVFSSGGDPHTMRPSTTALEALWSFPAPGIPRSQVGKRYTPFDEDVKSEAMQIPLWTDSIGDAWKTLSGSGPWSNDLEPRDKQATAWAEWFHHTRARSAGFIQMIIERQLLDRVNSLVDEEGRWTSTSAKTRLDNLLLQHPTLRNWIIALAGPNPDAHTAHEAAFAMLYAPEAIFAFLAEFIGCVSNIDDPEFAQALRFSFEAALLDSRITDIGRKRPWLKNTGFSRLELRTIALDPSCQPADLETLWRSGLQFVDLLDAGEWFGPSDLPAPLDIVNEALETVRLEGTVEDVSKRITQLLHEAQQARQWSVPWGARIQVQFGPFIAMRIFEVCGEFSCHFLDQQDRYLHVAIGLGQESPRISTLELIRRPDDGGDPLWNDDAALSLQLIAAAIVRDFLVVEDRDSVFTARPLRKQIAGRKISTIIYLPRVRYNRLLRQEKHTNDDNDTKRPRHTVTQHIRRANTASAAQRFLAQRFGVALPNGFTFVRPHERGALANDERVRVYRSRSASYMIFEEIAVAPEGSRPAWFEFEKACAQLLESEGMKVIHQAAQRDGDGGVDLFAVDVDGNSWVVQCKCWAPHRPIGPDVVRELIGAIARADRGATRSSRGMIITTSSLTSGAASEAIACTFRIIDGTMLAKLLRTA